MCSALHFLLLHTLIIALKLAGLKVGYPDYNCLLVYRVLYPSGFLPLMWVYRALVCSDPDLTLAPVY